MTARSTFIRLMVIVAASLLLAGIALMIQVSSKRSAASSQPPAVQDADAPTVARTAVPPAVTIEAPRAHVSSVLPPLAARVESPAEPSVANPGVAGMVVGIDPETGKLGMPTREQMKKLSELEQQRIDHAPADLVEVHHPDGSVSVDLQGRFQEYATVRIGPDGKKIFHCVDGRENAERVLKGSAQAAGSAPTEDAPAPQQPEER